MSCWRPMARSCFGDSCPRTTNTASCAFAAGPSRAIRSCSARQSTSKASRVASVGIDAAFHIPTRRNKSLQTTPTCIFIAPIISPDSHPSRLLLLPDARLRIHRAWLLPCSLRSFPWRSVRPAARWVIRAGWRIQPCAVSIHLRAEQSRRPLHRLLVDPLRHRWTSRLRRIPHLTIHHLFRIHCRSRPTWKKKST